MANRAALELAAPPRVRAERLDHAAGARAGGDGDGAGGQPLAGGEHDGLDGAVGAALEGGG